MTTLSRKHTVPRKLKTVVTERVEREIKAIERVSKRASASPEAAQAFLQSAGIVDCRGKLAKKYR